MNKEWEIYHGDREKAHYDITLHTGEVYHCCYPNSFSWFPLVYKNKCYKGEKINDNKVSMIRLSKKHPLEVIEDNYKIDEI